MKSEARPKPVPVREVSASKCFRQLESTSQEAQLEPASNRTTEYPIHPIVAKLQSSSHNLARDNTPIFKIVTNEVRIRPSTSEEYVIIFDVLVRHKIEYYTYSPLKYIKVPNRGLPVDTTEDDIKEELQSIHRLSYPRSEGPVPLFLVVVQRTPQNAGTYNLEALFNIVLTVEKLRSSRGHPQCFNCQLFGHVYKHFSRQSVCDRCTNSYQTRDCEMPKSNDRSAVKCGNCREAGHSTSWKGYLKYKTYIKVFQNKKKKPAPSRGIALLLTSSEEGARRKPLLPHHHLPCRTRSPRRRRRRYHRRPTNRNSPQQRSSR